MVLPSFSTNVWAMPNFRPSREGNALTVTTSPGSSMAGRMERRARTPGAGSSNPHSSEARAADVRLRIPMAAGLRSLNIAMAAAMVAGEALRQMGRFPGG